MLVAAIDQHRDLAAVDHVGPAAEQREAGLLAAWRQEVLPSRRDPLLGRISGHSPMYVQTEDDFRAVLFRYGSARYYAALARHFARVTAAGQRYARQVHATHLPEERALRSGQDLALAWAAQGARVGLLDADIYGPSQPLMLGLENERPTSPDGKHLAAAGGYKGKGEIKIWDASLWQQSVVRSP